MAGDWRCIRESKGEVCGCLSFVVVLCVPRRSGCAVLDPAFDGGRGNGLTALATVDFLEGGLSTAHLPEPEGDVTYLRSCLGSMTH